MAPFRTFACFVMVMATMTERNLNLVVPLAHKATAMLLTATPIADYRSPALETNSAGIGVLNVSGDEPHAISSVAFLSFGIPFNGRPGGRSRKARRCSIGLSTRVRAATPV